MKRRTTAARKSVSSKRKKTVKRTANGKFASTKRGKSKTRVTRKSSVFASWK